MALTKITKLNIVILCLLAVTALLWGIALAGTNWFSAPTVSGGSVAFGLLKYCASDKDVDACLYLSAYPNDDQIWGPAKKYGILTFVLLFIGEVLAVVTFLGLLLTMVCFKSKARWLLKVFILVLVGGIFGILAMVTYTVAVFQSPEGKALASVTTKGGDYIITPIGIITDFAAGILLTVKCIADRRANSSTPAADAEAGAGKKKVDDKKMKTMGAKKGQASSEDEASDKKPDDPFGTSKAAPAAGAKGGKPPAKDQDNPFARTSSTPKSPRKTTTDDNPFGPSKARKEEENPFAAARGQGSDSASDGGDNPFARV